MATSKVIKFDPMAVAKWVEATALKVAKKHTRYAKEAMVIPVEDDRYYVQVDSDVQIAENIADAIDRNKHVWVKKHQEFPGEFDWASDTYIKDCSIVWFQIKP